MNKKFIAFFLLLFIPVYAYATAYSFNDGVQIGNAYINTSKYSDRNKYLILNNNQRYIMDNNGIMSFSNKFLNGGFLSYREFCIVTGNNSCNGKTYLVIPNSYWTLSGNSTNRFYINSVDGIGQKSDNNPSGVRVTEFVKPVTTVAGNGTNSKPWYFTGNYYVHLSSNSVKYASFVETGTNFLEKYAGTSCILGDEYCTNFDMIVSHGYENKKEDGCNFHLVSRDGEKQKFEIYGIKDDIECVSIFGKKEFTVSFNCSPGDGNIESKKVIYDENLTIPEYNCTRAGYTQKGWKTGDNEIWTSGSTIRFHFDDGEKGIKYKLLDLQAKWDPNKFTVQYNGNGNTGGSVSSHTCTYDEDCTLAANGFIKTYYKFKGWKLENSGDSLAEGASIKNASTGATITYYAQWELDAVNCAAGTYLKGNTFSCASCPAGKYCVGGTYVFGNSNDQGITGNCNAGRYSTGGASAATCTACPSGYTSNVGATAQNKCYMSVPAGKYLSAKASSATNCPAGQYRSGAVTKYYGESVSCTNCAANTYSTGGASSCAGCPSGYGVASGAGTAQNKCYMSVPAGKYLSAKASSSTNCPAGQYRSGTATVYYGNSVGCSGCGGGKWSSAGSSGCSTISAGCYGTNGTSSCPNRCGAGTYSGAGASGCSTCGGGTYSGAGASGCSTCPAGTYSGAGWSSCSGCGAGTTSGAGASSCYGCGNGGNVASWSSGCNIASCNSGYELRNNTCAYIGYWYTEPGHGYVDEPHYQNGWTCRENCLRWCREKMNANTNAWSCPEAPAEANYIFIPENYVNDGWGHYCWCRY